MPSVSKSNTSVQFSHMFIASLAIVERSEAYPANVTFTSFASHVVAAFSLLHGRFTSRTILDA